MIPVHAADADDGILLQADFEWKTAATAADWDFDTKSPASGVVALDREDGTALGRPDSGAVESMTGKGKYIDAGMVYAGWWQSDWAYGGFKLDNPMTSGKWSIEFDFNLRNDLNGYMLISLTSGIVEDYSKTNQFKLINGNSDGAFLVNGSALTGDLTPTTGNWYHYEMEMDRTAGTYTVTVSDDSAKTATGSGTVSVSSDFDGFMVGAGLNVYLDNIKIKGQTLNAPEMVKLPDWKSTYSTEEGYATINDNNGWSFGGFKFEKAMTEGQYDLSFDIQIVSSANNYGAVYLTDTSHGGNSQYSEFKLIDKNSDGKLVVGGNVVNGDYDITKWLTYKLHINRTTGAYTVTVTQKDDPSKTGTASGTNLPSKDFIYIMFGTSCNIKIDNILVQEYRDVPTIVSAKFVDGEGYETFKPDPNTTAMKITFTEPMDKTSLDNGVTFVGTDVPAVGTKTLSTDGKTYTITFSSTIAEGHNFRVVFADTVKSTYNKNLATVVKTYTANPTGVLLDVDYDENCPELVRWDGKCTDEYLTETDGNKYMKITTNYTGNGYMLKESIPTDGGNYKVKFDFMLPEVKDAKYLCINEALESGNGTAEVAYNQFGLLKTTEGKFGFNGAALGDYDVLANTWYSYNLSFKRSSGAFELAITLRGSDVPVAQASGTLQGVLYSDGMIYEKVYNSIKFHYVNTICVDNLYVAKVIPFEVEEIEFLNKNGESTVGSDGKVGMLTDKIVITMTEKIDDTTIGDKAFIYDISNGVHLTDFNVRVDGKKLTFSGLSLTANGEYTVGVEEGLKSKTSEKTLADDYDKEFEMGADVQKINSISFSTDGTKVIVNAENSKAAYEVTLILAYYDANGLLKVNPVQVAIKKGECGNFEADATVENVSGATEVKAMLWKSLTLCEPLVPSVSK